MEISYHLPITEEYETRGCKVKIDAASNANSVKIDVFNIKTGYGSSYIHVLLPGNDKGYSDRDMSEIRENLNNMLDQFGESEWNEIHFTNQILS